MRTCRQCKKRKHYTKFFKNKVTCKVCYPKSIYIPEYHLKRAYGLTQKSFSQMVKTQGGKCLICARRRRLIVDHCHKTGVVRGLLCFGCNTGLGLVETVGVEAVLKYLGRV